MDEYIKKEDIEQKIQDGINNLVLGHDAIEVLGMIYEMPAADVATVRHGQWLNIEEHMVMTYNTYFPMTATSETCSECNVRSAFLGKKSYVKDNRCPNCGAKMDGDDDD